ncbi:DAK2 domain-containing protein [Streptomyces roseoverticillatus]|uniref:DAK2 domain-containing protein n=1 Tax=Streptomyces roseoverticillatus TaxID=66429 RepID=UPI001F3730D9|nr:DAK2 domain-containing protein [Streptomyces roseoverticillatus]MCF3105830.1 DAK2 domain-containing protein [Streptomyces roseoverticillatus]
MPHTLDAAAVRTWCALALDALGRAREEIDAINVYPVPDGDTGTNLYLTVESAARAVDAVFDGHATTGPASRPTLPDAVRAMAHGALIGARGNSGTILAQLLRGMAEVLAENTRDAEGAEAAGGPHAGGPHGGRSHEAGGGAVAAEDSSAGHGAGPHEARLMPPADARAEHPAAHDAEQLRRALRRAVESAYEGVARPVEGTILTVAAAAADAAAGAQGDSAAVARAADEAARSALAMTPGQLDVLGRAGVVDSGGLGLVEVIGALARALSGEAAPWGPRGARTWTRPAAPYRQPAEHTRPHAETPHEAPAHGPVPCPTAAPDSAAPAFEVIYLLDADDTAIPRLRTRLDALGDSLVVVGGDGLWNVHVHVDDAGAAVEAGIDAGRPHRIRITHFAGSGDTAAATGQPAASRTREPAQRAVVAVVRGEGLAALCTDAGATVVAARPGERPASGELVDAIRRANAREVVLLPNDPELQHAAAAAAEQARAAGVRVALIPTRAAVQGIAALAVHEPARRFDEDVVAMTSAAGATRYAELAVAERQAWTMAGVCQAGDVLGLIDGDVAVIGSDLAVTAATVLDRMLAAGGEMVTLVLGADVPDAVADRLERHVRGVHLAVDTVVYRGGQQAPPLLIGIE